ncbi:MAG: DUF192 domain-containing protein [Nanoarchaeota archaeon]
MKKILSILFLFLLLFSCSSPQDIVTIKTAMGDIEVLIEIADSLDEQAVGLMYRTSLEENHGMLFVFESEEQKIFWMKNTKIPLDIIFIDASGIIVDINENFEPCAVDDCEKYYSKPAMYALEVNAGFVEGRGIVAGNTVTIE